MDESASVMTGIDNFINAHATAESVDDTDAMSVLTEKTTGNASMPQHSDPESEDDAESVGADQTNLEDHDSDVQTAPEPNWKDLAINPFETQDSKNEKPDDICSVMTKVSISQRKLPTGKFIDTLKTSSEIILGHEDDVTNALLLHFCCSFLSTLQQMPNADTKGDVLLDKSTAYVFPRGSSPMFKVYLMMTHINCKPRHNYNYVRHVISESQLDVMRVSQLLSYTDFPEQPVSEQERDKLTELVDRYDGTGIDDRSQFKPCEIHLKQFEMPDCGISIRVGKNDIGIESSEDCAPVYLVTAKSQINLLKQLIEDRDAFVAVPCKQPSLFSDVYKELYTIATHSTGDYLPLAQKGYFCVRVTKSSLASIRDIGSGFARAGRILREIHGPDRFSFGTRLTCTVKTSIPVKTKRTQAPLKPAIKASKNAKEVKPPKQTKDSSKKIEGAKDQGVVYYNDQPIKAFNRAGYSMTQQFANKVTRAIKALVTGSATVTNMEAILARSYQSIKGNRNRYSLLLRNRTIDGKLTYILDLCDLPVTWMSVDPELHISGVFMYLATCAQRQTTIEGSKLFSCPLES